MQLIVSLFGALFLVHIGHSVDYAVQLKGSLDSILKEARQYGIYFHRKVVSDVYIFQVNGDNDIERVSDFKDRFKEEIVSMETYKPVTGSFYSPSDLEQSQMERFRKEILRTDIQTCWPYYDPSIEKAWQLGFTGRGVTVGIVDNGVDIDHGDLTLNIDSKMSKSSVDDDPNPQYVHNYIHMIKDTSHGTLMAGLVGSEFGNAYCSAGVAYNASIIGLKVFKIDEDYRHGSVQAPIVSDEYVATALEYARHDVDIYACSFNSNKPYAPMSLPARKALKDGASKGRQGKGNIFVFSGGNKEGVIHDCNMETYASSIYTITISSVSRRGQKPKYALRCTCILASTFGDYRTFDGFKSMSKCITLLYERRNQPYREEHAIVSVELQLQVPGVMEANPDLTWRDMHHLIITTSSLSTLQVAKAKANAVGLMYSPFFGFGLLNATAMVIEAQLWKTVPEQVSSTFAFDQHRTRYDAQHCAIMAVITIPQHDTVPFVKYIEHVSVHLEYTMLKDTDQCFDIILRSSSTTCSFLLVHISHSYGNHKLSDSSITRKWTYTTVEFWGEETAQEMILIVENHCGEGCRFKLRNFTVTLYGTHTPSIPTTIYKNGTYTDCLQRYNFEQLPSKDLKPEKDKEGTIATAKILVAILVPIVCFIIIVVVYTLSRTGLLKVWHRRLERRISNAVVVFRQRFRQPDN